MKTNYTTKAFADFLRKRCEDEGFRIIPRKGVETVTDKTLLSELGNGPWFFFEAHEYPDGCGVYVGPNRQIVIVADPYNKDPTFEPRVKDCLSNR